jgi:hypothetical protein
MKEVGNFTDIVIRCGADQYYAHKVIVYLQSEFFLKAFSGYFKGIKNRNSKVVC